MVRVLRHGATGVSATTWAVSTANLMLWGWWALSAHQWVLASVEWFQAAGSLVVVLVVGLTRGAVVAAGVVAVVVAVSSLWGPMASVAAVGSVLAVRVPQIVTLARTKGTSQVSALTWVVSGIGNAVWCAWGVVTNHPTMVVGAGISVVSSAVIALLAIRQSGSTGEVSEVEAGLI